jgi:hypothetical protein
MSKMVNIITASTDLLDRIHKKAKYRLGMVAHICKPSYTGRDQENPGLRTAQVKSYQDPISINELGVVACTRDSSYSGGPKKEDPGLRLAQGNY